MGVGRDRVTGFESQFRGVDAVGRWVRKWPVGGLYEGEVRRGRVRGLVLRGVLPMSVRQGRVMLGPDEQR